MASHDNIQIHPFHFPYQNEIWYGMQLCTKKAHEGKKDLTEFYVLNLISALSWYQIPSQGKYGQERGFANICVFFSFFSPPCRTSLTFSWLKTIHHVILKISGVKGEGEQRLIRFGGSPLQVNCLHHSFHLQPFFSFSLRI